MLDCHLNNESLEIILKNLQSIESLDIQSRIFNNCREHRYNSPIRKYNKGFHSKVEEYTKILKLQW